MSQATTEEKLTSVLDYLVTLKTNINPQYSKPAEITATLNEFVDKGLEELINIVEEVSCELETK